jgi:hypothetical protein
MYYSAANFSHHSLIFVDMDAKNPKRLKLSSLAEQRARPPITGIRESLTRGPVTSPETTKCWKLKAGNNGYQKIVTFWSITPR